MRNNIGQRIKLGLRKKTLSSSSNRRESTSLILDDFSAHAYTDETNNRPHTINQVQRLGKVGDQNKDLE